MSNQTAVISSKNVVAASSKQASNSRASTIYDSLVLSKLLSKAKFPVLLGHLPSTNKNVAVKMFPFHKDQINSCFLNEIRFTNLRHENVISILHYEQEREAMYEDGSHKVSYTIMDLAPYGDFHDLLVSEKTQMDDKLARTFFHQLISGLEYLHSAGIAHMDLKCENLLLGDNYQLKIGDFDQAYLKEQNQIVTRGTVNYRAPELAQKRCKNPVAADIYSAGILLFAFKCNGFIPYNEKQGSEGLNMFEIMTSFPRLFWKKHIELQRKDASFFDEDFKALFMGMVGLNPQDRLSIQQIKESKWYNGAIYSQNELGSLMKSCY